MEKRECYRCRSYVTTLHKVEGDRFAGDVVEICELCYTTIAGCQLRYGPVSEEDYAKRELLINILQVGNHLRELIIERTSVKVEPEDTSPPPFVDCPTERQCSTNPIEGCANIDTCRPERKRT